MKNLLIFPAGTEIGIEIFNALKYSKFFRVFGATSLEDHSVYLYKRLITGLPYYDEDDFLLHLNKVIKMYKIDYIYPANDAVQFFLMQNEKYVAAQIVSAPRKTVEICRSKERTYKYLCEQGCFEFIPKVFESIEEIDKYPVFVKPDVGQGSVGAEIIYNEKQLKHRLEEEKKLVMCEYLAGEEYTVDCFTDRHGKLRVVSLRNRTRIRLGISVHSQVLDEDENVNKIAHSLNDRLQFQGAWFFQLKKNNEGDYKLLEVSPRIPGTMGVSRNKGINFPLLTLYNLGGYDIDIINNDYNISVDRAFINRYKIEIEYDVIYVDFDDTLIIDGQVNIILLAFLYQALEKNKKIILVTKHINDIQESLESYKISKDIFTDIIALKKTDEKTKYINSNKAIFIDDSFAERKCVSNEKGIPVFDLDMVESLIDWRR